MDIEALRRINELTKSLQEHGISKSSQDALEQAETILQPLQEKHKTTTATETQQTNNEALLERKYNLILEMNNKKFENAITTLQNNVNELTQEITRLKAELRNITTKNTPEIVVKKEEPVQKSEEPQQKETHPRQGSFAPGDISIEKMFYYGHK